MRFDYWILGWILTPVVFAAPTGEAIRLQSFHNHSRILIRVDQSVPVEWKNHTKGFEVLLKGLSLSDLGAPMGEEERWKRFYQKLSGPRIGAIDIKEVKEGVVVSGKWVFPTGKLELAHPKMESFDYREKSPPQYVVDFWIKPGPTLTQVNAERLKAQHAAKKEKMKQEASKRVERRLASVYRSEQIADSQRFCDKPLSKENDTFLEFYPFHEGFEFSKWFPGTTPDDGFVYFSPKSKEKEAQYVRLALRLYSQGKLGLSIKALDYFDQEFPQSGYGQEMHFLRANALIKLGLDLPAQQILKRLILDHKESPVALYSAMFLAARQVQEKAKHQALQTFFWLMENYPSHELSWVFHLGAAESLYFMKDLGRAAKEYRWVMEHAPSVRAKAQAAYRIGDLYLQRFQYDQSLAAYFQAVDHFPDQAGLFPSFYLNRGESYYQLEKFDRAETVFKEFQEKFPSHPQGWRASFRLGEIASRLPGGSAESKNARHWYYETINRYPRSPGATLARLRLLPCGDHAGFNFELASRFFDESRRFSAPSSVVMKDYNDFRALSHIRTLLSLGSSDEITVAAINELRRVKNPSIQKKIGQVINEFFQRTIVQLLEDNHPYEALSFYGLVESKVPEPDPHVNLEYLLLLSRAASEIGLGKYSEKLSQAYHQKRNIQLVKLNQGRSLSSTSASTTLVGLSGSLSQKEQAKKGSSEVSQNPSDGVSHDDLGELKAKVSVQPGDDSAELDALLDHSERMGRLSEENFAAAKALWIHAQASYEEAAWNKIRGLLQRVQAESPFSRQKEIILGVMSERRKNLDAAVKHALRAQLLGSSLGVDAWLARLRKEQGDLKTASTLYENLEKKLLLRAHMNRGEKVSSPVEKRGSSAGGEGESLPLPTENLGQEESQQEQWLGLSEEPTIESVYHAIADIYEKQGRWGDVAATYERAMENGLNIGPFQYSYARALLEQPHVGENVSKATQVLHSLVNSKPVSAATSGAAEGIASSAPGTSGQEVPSGGGTAGQSSEEEKSDKKFWRELARETLANGKVTGLITEDAKEGRQ